MQEDALKNSILILLFAALITVSCALAAEATLIDVGNGLIFDNNNTNDTARDDKYWLQDLALFTGAYDEQIAGIKQFYIKPSNLNRKLDSWRMANQEDMEGLWQYSTSTLKSLFTSSADMAESPPEQKDFLWFGRYDFSFIGLNPLGPDLIEIHRSAYIREMSFYNGQDDFLHYDDPNCWNIYIDYSTLDGRSPPLSPYDFYDGTSVGAWVVVDAPVPEPTTMLLFGTGMLGLIGSSIRRKKLSTECHTNCM